MKKITSISCITLATALFLAMSVYIFYLKNRQFSVINPTLPEEIVFAKTEDSFINGGIVFNASEWDNKQTALIWVHGWGVNFYSPTYISIGRAIAENGYTGFFVNTRMHDLGNVLGYKDGQRIRGGGYWGITADEVKDIAAWVDYAYSQGFKKVILAGHSAGWAAVRRYQLERQDDRVIGLISASGQILGSVGSEPEADPQYNEAVKYISEGLGEELIKDPNRSFPSYISAATYADNVSTPDNLSDFYGFETPNPGVKNISCPILVFYGTWGDVSDELELKRLEEVIQKQQLSINVTTTMIENTDHMYTNKERKVADVVSEWIGSLKNK